MKKIAALLYVALLAALLVAPAPVDARRRASATPTATATCPRGEYWKPDMRRCWIDPTPQPSGLIAVTREPTPTVVVPPMWPTLAPPGDGYPAPAPTWSPYP